MGLRASKLLDIFSNKPVCSRTASKPNKPTQRTLDTLFVRGSAQLVGQAKRLGEDFSLISQTLMSDGAA